MSIIPDVTIHVCIWRIKRRHLQVGENTVVSWLSVSMYTDNMNIVLCAVVVVLQQGPSVFTTAQSPIRDDVTHVSLVATADDNISLLCSSPNRKRFRWSYCALGCRQSELIYIGDVINRGFKKAARVRVSNCGDRKCTFTFIDLQLDDAGSFSCVGTGDNKYWSLTILGKCKS